MLNGGLKRKFLWFVAIILTVGGSPGVVASGLPLVIGPVISMCGFLLLIALDVYDYRITGSTIKAVAGAIFLIILGGFLFLFNNNLPGVSAQSLLLSQVFEINLMGEGSIIIIVVSSLRPRPR